jgi:uncharacterized protein (DUF305 family)
MKYLIIISTVTLVASCNNNSSSVQVKDRIDSVVAAIPLHDTIPMDKIKMQNPMLQSMLVTMKKMDIIKMGNDFDVDFANSMMIHHQAAIDMSELEVAKGGDMQIIDMAKNIITAQKAEIVLMKNFMANYEQHGANKMSNAKMDNSDSQNMLADEMKSMMDKMHNMKMTGNTDDDFVMLMIPHHASAVKMAKAEIAYGKDLALKKMAQKMMVDQNKEIATFVAWSTKLK